MRSNRLAISFAGFGLAVCLAAGQAFAGVTITSILAFARERAALNASYTLPASTAVRNMGVSRGGGGSFLVDVTLSAGAVWNPAGAPTAAQLSISTSGTVTYGPITLVNNPAGGSAATFLVPIVAGVPATPPTLTFVTTGLQVQDVANVIGTGGIIPIRMQTRDASTGVVFDVGSDTADFMMGIYGVTVSAPLVPGAALIDVSSNRTKFSNSVTVEASSSVGIDGKGTTTFSPTGTIFSLGPDDAVEFRISGDLSGITTIAWANAAKILGTADVIAGSVVISIAGDNQNLSGGTHGERRAFTLTVDGTSVLNARSFTVTATLRLNEVLNRVVVQSSPLTSWSLNGTVLLANWINGNNSVLNSRIYLWNRNTLPGIVTISVFTLPNSATGSIPLGVLQWGTLNGRSGAAIKLAEDILTPLGIALPYLDNGGNLLLEIAVRSIGVVGVSQTFTNSFAYGTYSLAIIN